MEQNQKEDSEVIKVGIPISTELIDTVLCLAFGGGGITHWCDRVEVI